MVTESNNSGFESSHTEVSSDDVLETKPVTTVPEKETENSQETASDSVQTETGTVLFETDVDGSELRDNEFYVVYDAEENGALTLNEGESYMVRITAEDPTGRNNLTVWACPGEATDTSYAVVNGEQQDYTLRIKVR